MFSKGTSLQLPSPWRSGSRCWARSTLDTCQSHPTPVREGDIGRSPWHRGNAPAVSTNLFSHFSVPPSLGLCRVPLISGWQLPRDWSCLAVALRNTPGELKPHVAKKPFATKMFSCQSVHFFSQNFILMSCESVSTSDLG